MIFAYLYLAFDRSLLEEFVTLLFYLSSNVENENQNQYVKV